MSTLQGGPGNIVTNGLVLYLDAANTLSYTSGSTVWNDLSGNNNNGTLINGPTFSSGNAGSIVFDGVDDRINCSGISPYISQDITISFWVNFDIIDGKTFSIIRIPVERPTADLTYLYIYRNSWWDNGQLSFLCTYVKTNGAIANRQHYSPINYFKSNIWYNLVATYDNTGRSKFYANGNLLQNTSPDGQFTRWVNVIEGTVLFQLSTDGKTSDLKIYNRSLTEEEVLQNYNATKGRFGL